MAMKRRMALILGTALAVTILSAHAFHEAERALRMEASWPGYRVSC